MDPPFPILPNVIWQMIFSYLFEILDNRDKLIEEWMGYTLSNSWNMVTLVCKKWNELAYTTIKRLEFFDLKWDKMNHFYEKLMKMDKTKKNLKLETLKFVRTKTEKIIEYPSRIKELQIFEATKETIEQIKPNDKNFHLILQFKKVVPTLDCIDPEIKHLTLRLLPDSKLENEFTITKEKNLKSFFLKKIDISLNVYFQILKFYNQLEEIGFCSSPKFFKKKINIEEFSKVSKNLRSIYWEDSTNPIEQFLTLIQEFSFESLQKLTIKATSDPRFHENIPEKIYFPNLSSNLVCLTLEFSYFLTSCQSFKSFPVSLKYLHLSKTSSPISFANDDPLMSERSRSLKEIMIIEDELKHLINLNTLIIEKNIDFHSHLIPFIHTLHVKFQPLEEPIFIKSISKHCPSSKLILEGCELNSAQLGYFSMDFVDIVLDCCPQIERSDLSLLPKSSVLDRVLFLPAPSNSGFSNILNK